jgi:hypothetical protein
VCSAALAFLPLGAGLSFPDLCTCSKTLSAPTVVQNVELCHWHRAGPNWPSGS